MGVIMTKKEVSKITGVSLRELQFYTERHILPNIIVDTGRGNPRDYVEMKLIQEFDIYNDFRLYINLNAIYKEMTKKFDFI